MHFCHPYNRKEGRYDKNIQQIYYSYNYCFTSSSSIAPRAVHIRYDMLCILTRTWPTLHCRDIVFTDRMDSSAYMTISANRCKRSMIERLQNPPGIVVCFNINQRKMNNLSNSFSRKAIRFTHLVVRIAYCDHFHSSTSKEDTCAI